MKLRSIIKTKSKKGSPANVIIFIASIAAFAIFLLIVGYIGRTVATELQGKIGISDEINRSLQTTITTSTVSLNLFWYIVFAGLLLGIFISAWFIPEMPGVMIPVFALTLIVSIIIAIAMANTYDKLANDAALASQSAYQTGVTFMMTKLPYLAAIVGLLAMIIAFSRPTGVGSGGGTVIN